MLQRLPVSNKRLQPRLQPRRRRKPYAVDFVEPDCETCVVAGGSPEVFPSAAGTQPAMTGPRRGACSDLCTTCPPTVSGFRPVADTIMPEAYEQGGLMSP